VPLDRDREELLMTCRECEKAQDNPLTAAFVRIGIGNVMIVGCGEHVCELIESLDRVRLFDDAVKTFGFAPIKEITCLQDAVRLFWADLTETEKEVARKVFGAESVEPKKGV
jgi:hypothetical protein